MTNVVDRPIAAGQIPVHVLIVVVGQYLDEFQDLPESGEFAQELVDFWRSENRLYPANQTLATIEVLVSAPGGETRIKGDKPSQVVDRPGYPAVNAAMRKWIDLIANTEGAVGFLHWIGHGSERTSGGMAATLACDGGTSYPGVQSALNWSKALGYINARIKDQPVYCFIDACRTTGPIPEGYEVPGIDNGEMFGMFEPDRAYVFNSTAKGAPAFWVTDPKPQSAIAGCDRHAMGTRAFMAALAGFGARYVSGEHMPITAPGIVEAARALIERWSLHQGLQPAAPEGPRSPDADRSVLMTRDPMSAVRVFAHQRPKDGQCQARPVGSRDAHDAETTRAPYEFRLARKPHSFRFGEATWENELPLLHPSVRLYESSVS